MSTWITIEDNADIDYDPKENTIDILYSGDNSGNNYVSVPVEYILEVLTSNGYLIDRL